MCVYIISYFTLIPESIHDQVTLLFPIDAPDWVPDEACSFCTACKAPFTVIRRKHHCRSCGKVMFVMQWRGCQMQSMPGERGAYACLPKDDISEYIKGHTIVQQERLYREEYACRHIFLFLDWEQCIQNGVCRLVQWWNSHIQHLQLHIWFLFLLAALILSSERWVDWIQAYTIVFHSSDFNNGNCPWMHADTQIFKCNSGHADLFCT